MPSSQEVDRRYPEAYEWNAKREKEGRTLMKRAPFFGALVGLFILFLTATLGASIWPQAFKGTPETAITIGLFVGLPIGWGYYRWCYDSGLNMVLRAQQMLVAIDTEHNTRRIAEALRQTETDGQPVQALDEITKA